MNIKQRWVLCGLLISVVGVAACAAAWAVDGEQPEEKGTSPKKAVSYGAVIRDDADPGDGNADRVAPKKEKEEVPDPALAEILEIRRRLGENPFRGTIFDPASRAVEDENGVPAAGAEAELNRAFSDALKAVASDAAARPRVVEPTPDVHAPFSPGPVDAGFVGALRQAARALDHKAAGLESMRQYDEADQLRRLANRLRRQARVYDEPAVP